MNARILLDSLFPDDTGPLDLRDHLPTLNLPLDVATRRWTKDEILAVLETTPKRKAPELDRIDAAMVHSLLESPFFLDTFHSLVNACLTHSYFPSLWKTGLVRALQKQPDKDPGAASSYRPICLLPILGKALERLVVRRLKPVLLHPDFASSWQFGFRKGRSAEDAIFRVRQIVDAFPQKYALGILFDATAAFNHLWWPSIFTELSHRECPADLAYLIASYLLDRTVILKGNFNSCSELSKGCPQGSILGPNLWNLVMGSLLRTLTRNAISFVAYADDLLVIVSGDSRPEIEDCAQEATNIVSNWVTEHRLLLSTSKTILGELKGTSVLRPRLSI